MTDLNKRSLIKLAALTAVASAALIGCGKKEEAAAPAAAPAPAPAAAEAPKPEPLKVAFAYVGPVGDGGWTFAHDNGRKAVEEWGSNFNGELHLSDLVHAHDDPDWVAAMAIAKLAKLKPADRAFFDIQLAVVGGPKVLAALRKSTGAFKDQAKKIEDQLSLCA